MFSWEVQPFVLQVQALGSALLVHFWSTVFEVPVWAQEGQFLVPLLVQVEEVQERELSLSGVHVLVWCTLKVLQG